MPGKQLPGDSHTRVSVSLTGDWKREHFQPAFLHSDHWTKTHFHALRSGVGGSFELNDGFFLFAHKTGFKRSGNDSVLGRRAPPKFSPIWWKNK